jgi:calcium-dependent protein kinase
MYIQCEITYVLYMTARSEKYTYKRPSLCSTMSHNPPSTMSNNPPSNKKMKLDTPKTATIHQHVEPDYLHQQVKYSLEKKLNNGKYGTVYEGERLEVATRNKVAKRNKVAVKRIPKSEMSPIKTRHEIDMLNAVRGGPHILRFIDKYEDSDYHYIVTELCRGGELFDYILQRSLLESECVQVIRQLLEAVQYCHEKRIVHCDIKPENIMLRSSWGRPNEPDICLVDFGVAQRLTPGDKLNGLRGTDDYMAPEVIRGSYDEKADLWSIGALMFVMVTQALPRYQGYPVGTELTFQDKYNKLYHAKLEFAKNPFKYYPTVSQDFRDFVVAIMHENTEQRFSAADALERLGQLATLSSEPAKYDGGSQRRLVRQNAMSVSMF